jgi:ABC-type nitrate/sulfonate/bicarbonate transport system ATPase subunit
MPAEGDEAMIEAPPTGPGAELRSTAAVQVEHVSRTFPGSPSSPGSPGNPGRRGQPGRRGRPGRRASVHALADVSLHAAPGEIVTVVGPSGCGKTTLLELVCGLQRPDSGSVTSAPAALMPQRDLLLPWLSALDNAGLALHARGIKRTAAREQAAPWFARFGLEGFEQTRPAQLSGGMRQRVSFLRSLLAGKPVLALDEPFAALDAITRVEMQGWLGRVLVTEPRTVVLVTHDVEEAVVLGDRVVVLSPRPGRTVATVEIDKPRPRHRTDPEIVELRERVLEALGVSA